jgi:hypothetical protein
MKGISTYSLYPDKPVFYVRRGATTFPANQADIAHSRGRMSPGTKITHAVSVRLDAALRYCGS